MDPSVMTAFLPPKFQPVAAGLLGLVGCAVRLLRSLDALVRATLTAHPSSAPLLSIIALWFLGIVAATLGAVLLWIVAAWVADARCHRGPPGRRGSEGSTEGAVHADAELGNGDAA